MASKQELTQVRHYSLFQCSLFLLPFIPPISLAGFFIFSIKNAFSFSSENNIHANTYFKLLIYPCILMTCATFLLSCFAAYNKLEAFTVSLNFLPFFLLFLAVASTFNSHKYKWALNCILIASVPVIIFATIEFAFNQYGYYNIDRFILQDPGIRHPRSSSVFDNSNVLASYLVVLLGISLGMLTKYYPKKHKDYSGIAERFSDHQSILLIKAYICSDLIAIICTQSRNALLVTIILFCTSTIFFKPRNLHFAFLLIITILGFCLLKHVTLIRYISGDLFLTSSMARELLTFATDSRTKIWEVAVYLGKERPFLGWGLGNYKLLYPVQSIGTPPHPHNFWLMLFAETGIMGAVSLNMFVGSILYQAIRRINMTEKEEKSILISYLMAFSASVMFHFFDCPLFDFRVNCLNWIFLAGIFSLSSKKSIVVDENTIRLSTEMTHHNVVFVDHATQAYIKPDQAKKISG